MSHPYQCIEAVGERLLIAACGPKLLVLDLEDGNLVSEWSAESVTAAQLNGKDEGNEIEERPAKKQKTNNAAAKAPNVIKLAVSEDVKHVVAVTDDKFVHVFEHEFGILTELSQRCMPKRPCAILIMPDNATILTADKFGDVYSLPLIPSEKADEAAGAQQSTPQAPTAFKPSANNLTVHSQRNLKALAAQTNQKNFTPRKEPLKFEHKLLLGHVSMLTDMKYIVHHEGGKERGYIITADRDEHIRISRGPPQAHIIEGYCLGHTEFISKICRVGETNLLVSGGGDSWLGVWDWPEYKLRKKIDLLQHVKEIAGHAKDEQIAVSGIWTMSIDAARGMDTEDVVMVACEKVPAIFFFTLSYLMADASKHETPKFGTDAVAILEFRSCPLDVVVRGDNAIVSIDDRKDGKERLQSFWPRKKGSANNPTSPVEIEASDDDLIENLKTLNEYQASKEGVTDKDLDGLLYGVAEMRKRRDAQDGGGNAEGEADEAQEG